ncbi:MAG: sugar phosphate isomerase/epimerase [Candidatus Aureabacteria bacterium]|nr:sugar phosphate isomerase/epimerase [Candidatus Auribacterota bacterium]
MDNNIFFGVPLDYLLEHEQLVGRYRVNAEVFVDGDVLERLEPSRTARARALLDAHRCRRRVHGPISDMILGASDPAVRAACVARYMQAIEFAVAMGGEAVVFHSGYDTLNKRGLESAYRDALVASLRELCAAAGKRNVRLVIENTFEPAPDLLIEALEAVGAGNLGLCFDIAHRHVFGRAPLDEWVRRCARVIEEVHITDNAGAWDEHLAPGAGSIDFDAVFGLFRTHGVRAVITFEPHSEEAFVQTMGFIERHKSYFSG